jgi:hypothetical protein
MTTAQPAILSGAAVGIAGVFAPAITARLDRKHRRDLAQADRRHTLRSRTYGDIGAFLERERLFVMRTEATIVIQEAHRKTNLFARRDGISRRRRVAAAV